MSKLQSASNHIRELIVIFALMLVTGSAITTATPPGTESATQSALPSKYDSLFEATSNLPLSFIPNAGQTDSHVLYQVRGLPGNIYFTQDKITFALPDSTQEGKLNSLQLEFLEASSNLTISPLTRLPGKVNYFYGNNPDAWLTNIATYSGVDYENLYQGIDLTYSGTDGLLKSTFRVAPNTDPNQIRWNYEGASRLEVDEVSGNLLIHLPNGDILAEQAPI